MVGAPSTNYFGKPHPHRVWLFYVHVKRQRDKEEKGRRGEGEKGRGKRERRGTGARQIELLAALSRATTRTAPQGRMRATAGERKVGATHGQRACTRLIVPWPGRAAMLVDGNGPC
jgi:hypothetical protein